MTESCPRIGVAVIIMRDEQVLMGWRIGKHGTNTWGFPGGHLELGETVEACARREVLEETGLTVGEIAFAAYTEDFFNAEKHYLTLFVTAEYIYGEAEIREPEACAVWKWYAWDVMPEPVLLPIINLKKQSYSPFVSTEA